MKQGAAGTAPLTPEEFREITGVPASVLDRLAAYVGLLEKWQRSLNLIGPGTLGDIWRRHILDSAQLHPLLEPPDPVILDIGSGAGFPGLVLAIMGGCRVQVVESNARKCAFMAEVNRLTEAGAMIHNCRTEDLAPIGAGIVTARACAPLDRLLTYAERHLAADGYCLFLKGRNAEQELTDSMKNWMIHASRVPSLTDPSGAILKLEEVSRRHG